MQQRFFKNISKYDIIFIVLFIMICFFYQFHNIIGLRPESIHQWRQTICTSIELNYYLHGMNFFRPEVHHLFSDGGTSGQSLAEFPILYYVNAVLWKILGVSESIPRIVNLVIYFFGLFFLFRFLSRVLSPVWSLLICILCFTSPVFVFYGFGYLVDIPAFSICLISIYFFFNYYEFGKQKDLYLFLFFSLLAVLLKITVSIFFLSIPVIFIFQKFRIIEFKEKVFKNPLRDIFLFFSVLLIVAGWYAYARYFDTIHGGWYTINDIFPMWDLDRAGIREVLKKFFEIQFYQFFIPLTTFLLIFLFIGIILLYKKTDKIYFIFTMMLVFGSLVYAVMWFKVWNVHDYYLFLFLLPALFVIITFLDYLKKHQSEIFYSKKIQIIAALFVLLNVWYCRNNIRMRYGIKTTEIPFMATKAEIELWNWFSWNYGNTLKPLETIESYNRSLGISPDDPVISIPDKSICITLYLMNQKGWTEFGNHFYEKDDISEKIKTGAKYLILNDSTHVNNPFINPYTKHKIGQYKNISIYSLR